LERSKRSRFGGKKEKSPSLFLWIEFSHRIPMRAHKEHLEENQQKKISLHHHIENIYAIQHTAYSVLLGLYLLLYIVLRESTFAHKDYKAGCASETPLSLSLLDYTTRSSALCKQNEVSWPAQDPHYHPHSPASLLLGSFSSWW
jgi:hypothetical protein